jgi:hypothetical protein
MTPLNGSSLGTAWWFAPLVPWRRRALGHLANGVAMQPEHPGRLSNAHPFDVAGSANPAIQPHCVHPLHLLSEHCSMLLNEGQWWHTFQPPQAVFKTTLLGHYLPAVHTNRGNTFP